MIKLLWKLRSFDRPHTPNLSIPFVSPASLSTKASRRASNSLAPKTTMTEETPDYKTWDNDQLIARVTELERQLKEHTKSLKSKPKPPTPPPFSFNPTPSAPGKPHVPRAFDPSKYSTRHIALKFAYLGQHYNGYEHHNGNVTPLPTVEETLWKALRKGYLINPVDVDTLGKNEISWEGCQYSKCGRTDRGVSAFGQVVGVRVRSKRPKRMDEDMTIKEKDGELSDATEDQVDTFDPIADELPYIQLLNNILPPDIRVLAWCPSPPPTFDARFSCKERRYRYFFTQPAFSPTPGPLGFRRVPGSKNREGWLNIEAMREGAKSLVGLHDFRNFCKVDPSKQITNFERRILHADIEAVDPRTSPVGYVGNGDFRQFADQIVNGHQQDGANLADKYDSSLTPEIYSFTVHGTAFLWHQVRCMVAVLFLIGQGLESPSLVSKLLDVQANPRKPVYEMATDAPLVLWDCIFSADGTRPTDGGGDRLDRLDWVYAGDSRGLKALPGKTDGKFGVGGVVDDLWNIWRQRKTDEVLAGMLLDLAVGQGDSTVSQNGGFKADYKSLPQSQKLFEGRDAVRLSGKYVAVMQKPLMETVEVQNAKFLARKGTAVGSTGNGDE